MKTLGFADAVRLIEGLRSTVSLWAPLRKWPHVYWLAVYCAEARAQVGRAQRRRIARFTAVAILPRALDELRHALHLREAAAIDDVLAEVRRLAEPNTPGVLVVPDPSREALAPGVVPVGVHVQVPAAVLRGPRAYKVKLRHEERCRRCGEPIPSGMVAMWSRHAGSVHLTCKPITDDELMTALERAS